MGRTGDLSLSAPRGIFFLRELQEVSARQAKKVSDGHSPEILSRKPQRHHHRSGRGLGLKSPRPLAEAGAHVWLTAAMPRRCNSGRLVAQGRRQGDYAAFDIADTQSRAALVHRIMSDLGHLDILVNNVGARDRRPLAEFSDEDVLELIRTDLTSSISLSRDAAEAMAAKSYGRIITITSIHGHIVRPGDAIYPSPNMGDGPDAGIAVEYGARGITSNAIAPGMFATETNAALPKILRWWPSPSCACRWNAGAVPDEMSGAALFSGHDAASFVNGHVLTVDGGMSVRL